MWVGQICHAPAIMIEAFDTECRLHYLLIDTKCHVTVTVWYFWYNKPHYLELSFRNTHTCAIYVCLI